jgi:hypothetical protein
MHAGGSRCRLPAVLSGAEASVSGAEARPARVCPVGNRFPAGTKNGFPPVMGTRFH